MNSKYTFINNKQIPQKRKCKECGKLFDHTEMSVQFNQTSGGEGARWLLGERRIQQTHSVCKKCLNEPKIRFRRNK